MTESTNPIPPVTPPSSPSSQPSNQPPAAFNTQSANALDAWRKLLQGGSAVRPTDEQVKKFMEGAMKMCANCIQDSLKAHKREMQQQREANS